MQNDYPKCGTCIAWIHDRCRFGPPSVLLAGIQQPRLAGGQPMAVTVTAWPEVSANEVGCLHHRPRMEPINVSANGEIMIEIKAP